MIYYSLLSLTPPPPEQRICRYYRLPRRKWHTLMANYAVSSCTYREINKEVKEREQEEKTKLWHVVCQHVGEWRDFY